jgi:hypothetical protein
MTWVKLDDQLHSHPKVKKAWRTYWASLGLHLLALSHAGAYFPDGFVPEEFVAERVPRRSQRQKVIQTLVEARLWIPKEGGWEISGYTKCNPIGRTTPPLLDQIGRKSRGAPIHGPAGARTARPVPSLPDPELASYEDRI